MRLGQQWSRSGLAEEDLSTGISAHSEIEKMYGVGCGTKVPAGDRL